MQKIFWFLIFLMVKLFSDNNLTLEHFMVYKTVNTTLSMNKIKEKKHLFTPISKKNTLISPKTISWIQIKFNQNMPSGKYLVYYKGFEFDSSSYTSRQKLTKYISHKLQVYSFKYDKKRDSKTYYFKLINVKHYASPFLKVENFEKYYQKSILKPDSKEFYLLFGIIVGFMLMVGSYNLSIFYFHRENSFFYYSMMQLCMIFIMFYQFGISSLNMIAYNSATLISSIFATLFMRSFLDTSKYLPKLDKVLIFYLFLLFFDLLHLYIWDYSLISYFALYAIFGLLYLFIGFFRYKEGFIPARFFLIGWSLLIISIFITENIGDVYGISPLLFGPLLESIFLSVALAYRLKLIIDEKNEQQELLIHQSKLASMGEMIGNIAHQWKQPLTYLSYNFMNLRESSKRNLLDDNYLCKKLDKADVQLEFMSQTIDNFKDFYLPNKIKESFSVKKASLETLEILSYVFEQKNIEVIIDVNIDIEIESYKNAYKQVLLNLLMNAKDIFNQRKIVNPKIRISINQNFISVSDNGGGIKKEILKRIYDPYFTTKEGNLGIGLYMSKMIIEKDMNGELEVENTLEGATFNIKL